MKRLKLNLDLTGVIVTLAVGVLLPVLLSTAAAIVAIVLAQDAGTIITGALVISFTVTAGGCALVAVLLTSKKARLARRQADFLAAVSHELRTPLSAIKLYAQTLESGRLADDPEQTARCVATILRETEWLDALVDKVLTWRAASRDVVSLDFAAASVDGAVSAAVERFRAMVPVDDINLTAQLDSQQRVRHDAGAIEAVALNLLTNAYKYTGDDKQITVLTRDKGAAVAIVVRDNGIGLTSHEAKQVFQPFYRARQPDGSSSGGIGLGLAIARDIITRHGGTIVAAGEKERGATFTISLPVTGGER